MNTICTTYERELNLQTERTAVVNFNFNSMAKISYLVRTMLFWNNFQYVQSKSKD